MIPFTVLERCLRVIELSGIMAEKGNQNSISDAGVGVLSAKCAAEGAYLNVVINLADIKDPDWVVDVRRKADSIIEQIRTSSAAKMDVVNKALKI